MWLNSINNLDYLLLIRLIKVFSSSENIYKYSQNKEYFNKILIDNKIILKEEIKQEIFSSKIKVNSYKKYLFLKENGIKIIPIYSKNYPKKLLETYSPPICIYTYGNEKLLNADIPKFHMYFKEKFSSNGKKIYKIFSKYLKEKEILNVYNVDIKNQKNVFNAKDKYSIYIVNENPINFIRNISKYLDFNKEKLKYFLYNNVIILNNIKKYQEDSKEYLDIGQIELLTGIINYIIIPEAKYERDIAITCEIMSELSKEILVVPSNIYSDNSYFSNYLIKQGSDIILSKYDILFYIENKTNNTNLIY